MGHTPKRYGIVRRGDDMKYTERSVRIFTPLPLAAVGILSSAAPAVSADRPDLWMGMKIYPEKAKECFPAVFGRNEWKARLTPLQFSVPCERKTEAPFASALCSAFEEGVYHSAATGQPIFSSYATFNSATGWPSFFEPVSPDAVALKWDMSEGMERVEVLDSLSGSHLGHVFDDGPTPTERR
jgi:methionine-R-sulfoxide reductase